MLLCSAYTNRLRFCSRRSKKKTMLKRSQYLTPSLESPCDVLCYLPAPMDREHTVLIVNYFSPLSTFLLRIVVLISSVSFVGIWFDFSFIIFTSYTLLISHCMIVISGRLPSKIFTAADFLTSLYIPTPNPKPWVVIITASHHSRYHSTLNSGRDSMLKPPVLTRSLLRLLRLRKIAFTFLPHPEGWIQMKKALWEIIPKKIQLPQFFFSSKRRSNGSQDWTHQPRCIQITHLGAQVHILQ